jgi:phosphopantothenoylcysteine decarboxylase/phosphopantothenate--cysteine ligase
MPLPRKKPNLLGRRREILLGVTGSIAAYKAAEIIRTLRQANCNITVVMSPNAAQFVSPLTLQTLSGRRVYKDLFGLISEHDPAHISLSEKADLVLIAPATANFIAKIACGLADDLLSCIVLASSAPVLICPAMNKRMYEHKVLQGNVQKLKRLGFKFLGPAKGKLATGLEGIGRLVDTEAIVKEVSRLLRRCPHEKREF